MNDVFRPSLTNWQSQPALLLGPRLRFLRRDCLNSCQLQHQQQQRTKPYNMRLATDIIAQVVLVLGVISLAAASTWGFEDATVSVNGRKTEVGTGHKERYEALPFASSRGTD